MENRYEMNAKVFKAFCDENRLMIIEMLQNGEKCACHLLEQMNISQSTLSHHMKILCESGIVVSRKEGKWTYYSISCEGSKYACELLKELTQVISNKKCDDSRCHT
ncbi:MULTISPECIES: ArsR/SmtB family transcription factor [Clostridium]|uniref:ArsR/SmtB family transcription factor n=1 Tax=Clostridium TaxID=1485 RepID=UPI0002D1C1AD|nr:MULTISPECIES: metalloregulator ArsR/SmtB family transcription factor [Clostridium]ENZ35138.1 ArsR family transcriptional regulator [Clostridium butyricum 60E.3]KQB78492.1 ArsR family transcriptional regulator [Clostridium butyricum]MBO1685264.1 winged helix-turn-helix transcriptional regulator [Clostridium butyricum]MCQ2013171.1 metalloregulator ArsR/SmtB family transcription factor [Clostridium butyricum]MCQ2017574.1 metalloregulator ArsR/SmtB family transcription factor [Clostridium butyr